MATAVETNEFREALYNLYLMCCEKKGWDAERAVSRFEVEGEVSPSSIAKVLSGERRTLDLGSIDRLLEGLYDRGLGVLTTEERARWHEELHIARIVEMQKNHFLKLVNPNLPPLSEDQVKRLKDVARDLYQRTTDLWGIEGLLLPFLARQLYTEKELVEEPFLDDRNDWQYSAYTDMGRVRSAKKDMLIHDGQLTLLVPGCVIPHRVPYQEHFTVSATFGSGQNAAENQWVGVVIFDEGGYGDMHSRYPWTPPPKSQQFIVVIPSQQRFYVSDRSYSDSSSWQADQKGNEIWPDPEPPLVAADVSPGRRISDGLPHSSHISVQGANTLSITRLERTTSFAINGVEVDWATTDLPKTAKFGLFYGWPTRGYRGGNHEGYDQPITYLEHKTLSRGITPSWP